MTMEYKIEYLKNDGEPEDHSCYIQLRQNVPVYMSRIDKEAYEYGDNRNDWMDGIFQIPGIVEASSRAYRVWVSKSPVFTWSEVLGNLIPYMASVLGGGGSTELFGSGITLEHPNNRRDL